MSFKIDVKTLKMAYSFLKIGLKELDYKVGFPKEINHGIQFLLSKRGKEDLIRVYSSKKNGISADLSQVKNKAVERDVLLMLGFKPEDDSDENEASKTKSGSTVYSLCIGINKFEDKSIGNLKYAKADALKLDGLLTKKFGKSSCRINLVDKKATRENILKSLKINSQLLEVGCGQALILRYLVRNQLIAEENVFCRNTYY